MLDLLADVVSRLRRAGASHADARHVDDERAQAAFTATAAEERVDRLFRAASAGFGVRAVVDGAWGFATRDGTAVEQHLTYTGCGMKLVVERDGLVQHRSYPMELDGGVSAGGFEVVRAYDLPAHAPRIAEEALALLAAPPCPAGETSVIL